MNLINVSTSCYHQPPTYSGGSLDSFLYDYKNYKKKSEELEFCLDNFTKEEEVRVLSLRIFEDIGKYLNYNFSEDWFDFNDFQMSKEEFDNLPLEERIKRQTGKRPHEFIFRKLNSENIIFHWNEYYRIRELIISRKDLDEKYREECDLIDKQREESIRREAEDIYINTIKEKHKTSVDGLYADYYIEPDDFPKNDCDMNWNEYLYKNYQIQEQPNFTNLTQYRDHKRSWMQESVLVHFSLVHFFSLNFFLNERRKRLKNIEKSTDKELVKRTVYHQLFFKCSTSLFLALPFLTTTTVLYGFPHVYFNASLMTIQFFAACYFTTRGY